MFEYEIKTGRWYGPHMSGVGYSGFGVYRNDPHAVDIPDSGPTPPGLYKIGPAYDDPHLGPCVMHLDPLPGTHTFGRSLFRIHGDNATHTASHGCIILNHDLRVAIAHSGITEVKVY